MKKQHYLISILAIFLSFLPILFSVSEKHNVYGVELFTSNEKPFGLSYDEWISKYWNWWVSTSIEESTPTPGGCLINETDSMIMLMETTVGGSQDQVCDIASTKGIMIPLWIAWCDSGTDTEYPINELSTCAREKYNLGNIKSEVLVDGMQIAKLDVRLSLVGGSLDYKINSLENVSELFVKQFNLTAPDDSHKAFTLPGTFNAGAHGWFVFLKPLSLGEQTVFYNIRVTPIGPLTSPGTTANFADITYLFNVK